MESLAKQKKENKKYYVEGNVIRIYGDNTQQQKQTISKKITNKIDYRTLYTIGFVVWFVFAYLS